MSFLKTRFSQCTIIDTHVCGLPTVTWKLSHQEKSKDGVHCRIFYTTYPPPLHPGPLFSNEYNFFSIEHWLLLEKYVRHKKYPTDIIKTFFSLCLFPVKIVFFIIHGVNLCTRRFCIEIRLQIIFFRAKRRPKAWAELGIVLPKKQKWTKKTGRRRVRPFCTCLTFHFLVKVFTFLSLFQPQKLFIMFFTTPIWSKDTLRIFFSNQICFIPKKLFIFFFRFFFWISFRIFFCISQFYY
jgi:hypothetical protein